MELLIEAGFKRSTSERIVQHLLDKLTAKHDLSQLTTRQLISMLNEHAKGIIDCMDEEILPLLNDGLIEKELVCAGLTPSTATRTALHIVLSVKRELTGKKKDYPIEQYLNLVDHAFSHFISMLTPELAHKLCKGSITPGQISDMAAYEVFPNEWKEEVDFKEKGKEYARKLAAATTEGGVRCRKCGSTNTITASQQTRSADEGSTMFVQCKTCGAMSKLS